MSGPPKQLRPLPPAVRNRPPRAAGDCKVCYHVERHLIDIGLAEGRGTGPMSKRFGVSADSLRRHRHNHMPPALIHKILNGSNSALVVQNLEELRTSEGEKLLVNFVEIRRRLYLNAESAEAVGDYRSSTYAYSQIQKGLEYECRMLDAFKSNKRTVVNQLVLSPDYLRLRAALIDALAPYPAARTAVAKVLRDLETAEEVSPNGTGA